MAKHHGHCLCGAVAVTAELPEEMSACHCEMCTRWSGGIQMFIDAPEATVTLRRADQDIPVVDLRRARVVRRLRIGGLSAQRRKAMTWGYSNSRRGCSTMRRARA